MRSPPNPDDTSIPCRFWPGSVVMACWVLGCLLQLQQPRLWAVWAYVWVAALPGVLGLVCRVVRRRAGRRPTGPFGAWLRAVCWGGGALMLAFALCGLRASTIAQHRLDATLEGHNLRVTGVVAAMPQRNEGGLRFGLEVESADDNGTAVMLPPRLLLGWYGGAYPGADRMTPEPQRQPPDLQPGERWQLTVRLKAPHGSLNPHGLDYELWLWEQGVQATGYVRTGPQDAPPRRMGSTVWHPVERARQAVRDAIQIRLNDGTPEGQRRAGVVAALVTGDQTAIDRADWDIFRATGVAHLMSISGLHITLFAWVAAALIGALWRRSALWGWSWCLWLPAPTVALVGGVGLAAAYALFSGWGVPAQRTIAMLVTVGVLRSTGRQWPWQVVWLLACTMVVAWDPWALMQAGFWLSFVAVGVLFATDAGTPEPVNAAAPLFGAERLGLKLRQLLREQGVVTLALTPLSLLLFGQVSLVGLAANLLAIPWVTLVVTPLALGGVLVPALWDASAWALRPLAAFLEVMAAWPWATVSVAAAPVWVAVAGVLGGALLAMRLPWGLRAQGLPLLLPVLLWPAARPAADEFELLAADIGQGNAVIVRTAQHTLVYDTGPRISADSDAGHRVLVPLLRALDEHVDTLVLSHRDSDHIGGARAVLEMQPQAALLSSIESSHPLQALRPASRCVAGQSWTWDGVRFEVLHPYAADYDHLAKSNAMSCVLRIGNGRRTALLVGDIEAPQEAQLVSAGLSLQADVLLMPHHGSKTSSSPVFLDAVRPRFALAQAGYRNPYGHPAAPVLARYQERGIRVIDSPHCGAATWRSAMPAEVTCQRETGRRYWHHEVP